MNVCLYLFDKLFCLRRLKKSKKWPWLFSPFKLQFIFYLKTLTKRGKQWGWRCRGVGVGMGEKVNAVLYDKTTVLAQRHEIFVVLKNTISYTSICYPLISRLKRIQVGRGSNWGWGGEAWGHHPLMHPLYLLTNTCHLIQMSTDLTGNEIYIPHFFVSQKNE